MASIAFIGLTDIGKILVQKLKSAGHMVQVYPFDGETLEELVFKDLSVAEFIISLLPSEDQVRKLYLSRRGLIARISTQPIIIDCSFIAPKTAQLIAKSASSRHLSWLDAPFLGNVEEAQSGRLHFVVGATGSAFALAYPLLLCMGQKIFHSGRGGTGQAARVFSNVRQAIIMAATAESLELGFRNGLDPLVLATIMQSSGADRFSLCAPIEKCDESAIFPPSRLQLGPLLKDLTIAMDCAHDIQAFIPMGAMTRNLYSRHADNYPDGKKLDYSSIRMLFQES